MAKAEYELVAGSGPLDIALPFRAYGVLIQNLTAQWAFIADVGFISPNTSGGMPLQGTNKGQARFSAPPGVSQPGAVALQTCFLTYVDYPVPPTAGPTQGSALASVATLERFARAALPAVGNAGRLVELTDYDRGIWIDDGVSWHSIGGEVFDARAWGADPASSAATNDAAIAAALADLTAAGGGALYFPPFGQGGTSVYSCSGFTVPDKVYVVCHPLAALSLSGSIQLGSVSASRWQIGGVYRVQPTGAFAGPLLELVNLLGDPSRGSYQIVAVLSAAAAAADFVHIHSMNAVGFADVTMYVSCANFVANRAIVFRNGSDAGGGVASVAGDFMNGNKIYGDSLGCVTMGIRQEATGPEAGSVAGTCARNTFNRLDVNSYTGAASRGYFCDGTNVGRNRFYDCTFERAAAGGATYDVDSALGGGQYFVHPISRALSGQNLTARDVWEWDEFDEGNLFGLYGIRFGANRTHIAESLTWSCGRDTVAIGATEYTGPSARALLANERDVQAVAVKAGTLRRLFVRTDTAQGAGGNFVFTVMVNEVATAITLTIAAGAAAGIFSDVANSAVVAAGDRIDVRAVNNDGAAASAQVTSVGLALEIDTTY